MESQGRQTRAAVVVELQFPYQEVIPEAQVELVLS
jgi:hypothetical protein